MNTHSIFVSWANQNHLYTRKPPYTHLLFNGGRLNIPPHMEDEFFQCCAAALGEDEILYLIELKTSPVFKMFFEFDYDYDKPLADIELALIARHVQQTVVSAYAGVSPADLNVVVLTAPPDIQQCKVKSGIHMIWHIAVGVEEARALRNMVLEALSKQTTFRPINRWEDVVDEAPLKANGLRMAYSHKVKKCDSCGKTLVIDCSKCSGTGNIGRPYTLLAVLDASGDVNLAETELYKHDALLLLKNSSIRSAATVAWKHNITPEYFATAPTKRIAPDTAGKGKGAKRSKTANEPLEFGDIQDDLKRRAVDMVMKTILPVDCSVTKYECSTNGSVYRIVTNSKYCRNKEGHHNSSNVYFIITKRGWYQRCFSVKEVERVSGLCSKYSSPIVKLNKEQKALLFGGRMPQEHIPRIIDLRTAHELLLNGTLHIRGIFDKY